MNKKEFNVQKKRVLAAYHKWKPLLKLDNWKITLEILDEEESPQTEYPRGELRVVDSRLEAVMKNYADPYYLDAGITVYAPTLESYSDEDIEEFVLHELMHIILSPLFPNKKNSQEESVATLLARSFLQVETSLCR